jgi:hypothetical protein
MSDIFTVALFGSISCVMAAIKFKVHFYFVIESAGQPYCSAKFLSLRTGDEVHHIPYTEPVIDIKANDRSVQSLLQTFNTAFSLQVYYIT